MFAAYCDESYSGNLNTTPYYVVAGYCGPTDRWEYFESLWTDSMRELGIAGIGLHASKCANGAGPYEGMSDERRRDIQYRLIVDVAASRLMGFVAAIDVAAFRSRKPRLDEEVGKDNKKFNELHVVAVRHCAQMMVAVTEDVTDKIAFVFDRNKQFGQRAREWYELDVNDPRVRCSGQLGPFTEDDRMQSIGLQAADLLAYSAYRNLTDPRDRWQWSNLRHASHIVQQTADESFWADIDAAISGAE